MSTGFLEEAVPHLALLIQKNGRVDSIIWTALVRQQGLMAARQGLAGLLSSDKERSEPDRLERASSIGC
jgi:hypothetical protein